VRKSFYTAAAALAALGSWNSAGGIVATTAGVLFEATPFLLAGIALRLAIRGNDWIPYLGCGCAGPSSARSLPATAAAWFVFGPAVALSRLAGAVVVAELLQKRFFARSSQLCGAHQASRDDASSLLSQLEGVLPAAVLAGVVTQALERFDPAQAGPIAAVLCGLLLGMAAPCGLGTIAVASALHARAPIAAAAYLCVAGIVDVFSFRFANTGVRRSHDACSYAILMLSLAMVALRHGDALVHPKLVAALWACSAVTAALALRYRERGTFFISPAIMLLGALAAAPAPSYRATETTLTDLFPGERLSFTGRLTDDGTHAAIVRYAITCCRADAGPIVIRLDRSPGFATGTWLRADGVVTTKNGDLRLKPQTVTAIEPPSDPFVYR
jgi:hypothetical protein